MKFNKILNSNQRFLCSRRFEDGRFVKIGVVRPINGGYEFITNRPGRRSSRKIHSTVDAAIPRWVRNEANYYTTLDIKK